MKTSTINRSYDSKALNGTSRQGTLKANYDDIVEAFGVPDMYTKDFSDGKVRTRWAFQTANGPVSIYDYKPTQEPEDTHVWSIGGKNSEVVGLLKDIFSERTDMCGGCGYHVTRCKMTEDCFTPARPF
jgi:hypothetical protein